MHSVELLSYQFGVTPTLTIGVDSSEMVSFG